MRGGYIILRAHIAMDILDVPCVKRLADFDLHRRPRALNCMCVLQDARAVTLIVNLMDHLL